MNKLYNTQKDFARAFNDFIVNIDYNFRKTQLNILPYILFGMINAESSVSSDIAKELKDDFSLVQYDSVIKRIRRFFNNKFFDGELFYDALISHVISNYKKKHLDNRVHIIIDHMFSHDNYTTLMFSMRIGNQGIPIWFKSFKDKSNTDAFQEDLIISGINKVIEYFKDSGYELIFLADRWFNSTNLMKVISDAGYKFCFRMKKNIKVLIYDKKEGHKIWKWLSDLQSYEYHSICYNDIELTEDKYSCNIVISKRNGVSEPWILATNTDYKYSIKDYSYRFGGIETIFKNQKSNGFYLESTTNVSSKYYQNMYALVCTCVLFLTILGAEYSKNNSCYKNVKITTHKTYNINNTKVKKRMISLFNTGLTLFKLAVNSSKYIRIPMTFILYDI